MITPRSAGLNVSFHGISDDFAAIAFNPAGLNYVKKNELSIGFGFTRNSTETNYLDNMTSLNSNNEFLTHIGIVAPFKAGKSDAAIAIGYYMDGDYDNDMDFKAFNSKSTMVDYLAKNSPQVYDENPIYHLWLADSLFKTPVKDSLLQTSQFMESGGMHNLAGAVAFSLSDNLSMGMSIAGKWGSYKYRKIYKEQDIYNKYDSSEKVGYINLDWFKLDETLEQELMGITGSIGIQAKIEDYLRFGATIKFPTFYNVTEKYSYVATARYDDGWEPNKFDTPIEERSYNIRTPFIYCAGISLHASNITLTAGVEYSDVTQMSFSDATAEIEDINLEITRQLVGQTTFGIGAEYEVPLMPLVVRGSYALTTSPYQKDVSGATLNCYSIGAGYYPAPNIRIDGVFRFANHTEMRVNYGDNSYTYKVKPLNIGFQLTYRY